jgi:hypothetical protein
MLSWSAPLLSEVFVASLPWVSMLEHCWDLGNGTKYWWVPSQIYWSDILHMRLEDFEMPFKNGEFPVTEKLRLNSGCLHRL